MWTKCASIFEKLLTFKEKYTFFPSECHIHNSNETNGWCGFRHVVERQRRLWWPTRQPLRCFPSRVVAGCLYETNTTGLSPNVSLTDWCRGTREIACRYKRLLRRKRRPTCDDPGTEGVCRYTAARQNQEKKKDALSKIAILHTRPCCAPTLLTKSGATSGMLLNSPHTCRSLTQQMASLSSTKLWEPVINRVVWGRM